MERLSQQHIHFFAFVQIWSNENDVTKKRVFGGQMEQTNRFRLRNLCFRESFLTHMRVPQEMQKWIYKGIWFFDKGGMDGWGAKWENVVFA